jgi:hypothetical protein
MGEEMQKLALKIRRVVVWQNMVLALFGFVAVAMAFIFFTRDKSTVTWLVMPYLYLLEFGTPFALFVMIYTIFVLTSISKAVPMLKAKIAIAGWATVFVGVWTLGYFAFASEINLWAFLISHDFEVAVQSSPVVLGFALLALHVYVARVARKKISTAAAAENS